MRFICLLAWMWTCLHSGFVSGAETSRAEAKSISATAIRWLIFDEWGKDRPDDPYPGGKGDWLRHLREHFKKRLDTPLSANTFVADAAVSSGTYDMSKRILDVRDPVPAGGWNPHCLYIEISPTVTDRWRVALKFNTSWSYIEVARDGDDYHVTSFRHTLLVD
ncbi:MAG: hypothetical protein M3463_09010 [Verrucomicrobiota bacterium]|nr:hypothetical protein [Verrucomicrobiota bacterium]